MVQLLLERGVFSEAELLDLLTQCVNAYPSDAKREKIKLLGDERDKEVLDNVVLREITALLEPLAMKVCRAWPGRTSTPGMVPRSVCSAHHHSSAACPLRRLPCTPPAGSREAAAKAEAPLVAGGEEPQQGRQAGVLRHRQPARRPVCPARHQPQPEGAGVLPPAGGPARAFVPRHPSGPSARRSSPASSPRWPVSTSPRRPPLRLSSLAPRRHASPTVAASTATTRQRDSATARQRDSVTARQRDSATPAPRLSLERRQPPNPNPTDPNLALDLELELELEREP